MHSTKIHGCNVVLHVASAGSEPTIAWVSRGDCFAALSTLRRTGTLSAPRGATYDVERSTIDAITEWAIAHGYKEKERRRANPPTQG